MTQKTEYTLYTDVLFEFMLPEEKTEFYVESHWELGHGWSEREL